MNILRDKVVLISPPDVLQAVNIGHVCNACMPDRQQMLLPQEGYPLPELSIRIDRTLTQIVRGISGIYDGMGTQLYYNSVHQ
jgi:hypothetical protein